jgi:hypothetical protein
LKAALALEQFQSDVARHQMSVLLDSGRYRHLRFSAPNTNNQYFDIITWPYYLTITGDMGTFVFSRMDDMFQFFRGDRINESYWAEKLEAVDRHDGAKKFDAEYYVGRITEYVCESLEDDHRKDGVLAALKDELTSDLPHELYSAVNDFEHDGYSITDVWDITDGNVYTFRYIWALHAIVWGIGQYDAAMLSTAVAN